MRRFLSRGTSYRGKSLAALSFHKCSRCASTLVIAEHNNKELNPVTLNAITAASQIGGDVTALLMGSETKQV